MDHKPIRCPACDGGALTLKHEAKYIYSYHLDTDAPGNYNAERFYPYLYDKREQVEAGSYIECDVCGNRIPCSVIPGDGGVAITIPGDL